MLNKLEEYIDKLPELVQDHTKWSSLIINRRKPYTYRAFYQDGDYRVCLHRFEVCEPEEAFYHPHPWPGAFKILKGSYKMKIGYSTHIDTKPSQVTQLILPAGSSYEITSPLTWHTVEPISECYTVMVNGVPWSETVRHQDVKTTKGKDLESMTEEDLKAHLNTFKRLTEKVLEVLTARESFLIDKGTVFVVTHKNQLKKGGLVIVDDVKYRILDIEVPFHKVNEAYLLVKPHNI